MVEVLVTRMHDSVASSRIQSIATELGRIGLDINELPGLAGTDASLDALLAHLRTLQPGATWSAVFPEHAEGWRPDDRMPDRALGPFDYPVPPRGPAVFASLEGEDPEAAGVAALQHIAGLPIYGSAVVLDRGAPHLYVVLTLDASDDDVLSVIDAISAQPGIRNCFPARERSGDVDR